MPAETPTIAPTNVMVGVAALFTAPAGTAKPADTVAQNAISTPWVPAGATEEGVSVVFSRETVDIRVEEQSTPVQVAPNTSNFQLNTALSEDVLATMKLAYGGGTLTTVAAGPTQPGKTVLTLSETLDELAILLESTNPASFWRRVYIPTAISHAEVTTANRRAANNRSYAASFRAICPLPSIEIDEMTAPHT